MDAYVDFVIFGNQNLLSFPLYLPQIKIWHLSINTYPFYLLFHLRKMRKNQKNKEKKKKENEEQGKGHGGGSGSGLNNDGDGTSVQGKKTGKQR